MGTSRLPNKCTSLVVLFILCTSYSLCAIPSIPTPTTRQYVHDYAEVLSDSAEENIMMLGMELENLTGAQAVVVTIPSLESYPIENYTLELFRTWGIGQKGKDNGLLLCIATNDHQWRVEVGRGLEGAIPDALSHAIMLDYAKPAFIQGDYNNGILNSYHQFSSLIANEYGVTLTNSFNHQPTKSISHAHSSLWLIIVGLIVADLLLNRGRIFSSLLQIVFWSNLIHSRNPRGPGGGPGRTGGFGGGSSNGGGSSGNW